MGEEKGSEGGAGSGRFKTFYMVYTREQFIADGKRPFPVICNADFKAVKLTTVYHFPRPHKEDICLVVDVHYRNECVYFSLQNYPDLIYDSECFIECTKYDRDVFEAADSFIKNYKPINKGRAAEAIV